MLDLNIFVFVVYVLPGFIAMNVRDLVVPRKQDKDLGYLAEAVIASVYIMVIVYVLYWLIEFIATLPFKLPANPLFINDNEGDSVLILVLLAYLLSWPFGKLWSKFLLSECRGKIIRCVTGMDEGPYQTVWPSFTQDIRGQWVRIVLSNGARYGGWVNEYVIDREDSNIILSNAGLLDKDGFYIDQELLEDVYIRLNEVIAIEKMT